MAEPTMTKEIELAKQHGIQYRLTPEGTTEMWCHDRNVQAFAEALVAAERERCAKIVDVPPGTEAWEVIGGEEGLTMLRELAAQIRVA